MLKVAVATTTAIITITTTVIKKDFGWISEFVWKAPAKVGAFWLLLRSAQIIIYMIQPLQPLQPFQPLQLKT